MRNGNHRELPDDPLWYKDAVFYEVRVRSFCDSNGDGIGDFPGLTSKLDYLRDLGVTAIWMLPFYPSPLRDDGYDISDYTSVHPDCGTLHDFRTLLREAHERGLRVVTELVLNHTSDQHPWFERARRSPPGSAERAFYVWSDDPDRYRDARIIFQDFETSNWTWDPTSRSYYWHRFYAHQPDLNYDNPAVRRAILKVVDFWLGLGVDGLRLDAVPYLFEREGTSCENLPETHTFLRELRRHVDRKFKNRMLLAEANQWPEDAVAYLAEGRECQMAFHFPLMPRLFLAVRMEDRFPVTDVWAQTPEIHDSCQWALFLRNHDELTLEMVTDEERDYLLRAYAREPRMRINLGIRRRLAPLLGNNRRTIELKNALLFSLPGTPVVYYGDEIGMGDNVFLGDRDGVRTPMQWTGDRNAGFSTANPQQLVLPVIIDHEFHYQTVNVEAQDANRHSLLWWMRRLIALRKQYKAFGRGSIEFLSQENPKVLAFLRTYGEERILVVANLSRFVQVAELDLARWRGQRPTELFGRTQFPIVGDQPYVLTLGPHMFVWLALEVPAVAEAQLGLAAALPSLELEDAWPRPLAGDDREQIERALPDYLQRCRWFGGKSRKIKGARVSEAMPLAEPDGPVLTFVDAEYDDGEVETYTLPLALVRGERGRELRGRAPEQVLADVHGREEGVLCDATSHPEFGRALLALFHRRRALRGDRGTTRASVARGYDALRPEDGCELRQLKVEQSHSSLVCGERLIIKLFRKIDEGVSPELEVGRRLSEGAGFAHTPQLLAWLEYATRRREPRTLAVMHAFVPNQGDAWHYTHDELRRFFERAAARKGAHLAAPPLPLVALLDEGPDAATRNLMGAYLDVARLLGRRTAELHQALAAVKDDPAFRPEPYTALYQRAMYQSMRNLTGQVMRRLRGRIPSLAEPLRSRARRLLERQERVVARFEAFRRRRVTSSRIRCHGDLHLGQVLHTGRDLVFLDFEGEPARPLSDRRRKRSSLRDVAGMLGSFRYAAQAVRRELVSSGMLGEVDEAATERWAVLWQTWCSWAFLQEYLEVAGRAPFAPADRDELRVLLDAFLLEKALYELGYEIDHRPDWLPLPIHGLEQLLGEDALDLEAARARAGRTVDSF